jgi:hydrogenase expression/formation protein HypE
MNDYITINQGSGGKLTHDLITNLFVKKFGIVEPLTDSAILNESGYTISFTTDSYVVNPIFFPGGDIGKLSVCGTVNDLAVSGAVPRFIAASFIIEEGFPLRDLIKVVESMAEAAFKAGVKIVTGDTKVVEKGKCDKLFITTSGIGILKKGFEHISTGSLIKPGDKLLVNGSLGNHALAVLGARTNLGFSIPVHSDCASLNHLIQRVIGSCNEVHFMRDLTRGGLATVLNELSGITGYGILIEEASIPVDEPVKGFCETLGFDPLYLANEGKVLIVVSSGQENTALEIMRSDTCGTNSEVIGELVHDDKHLVILNTSAGGKRILDMPSGQQLPRIC